MPTFAELKKDLRKLADPKRAEILSRFFKTGPGEYGEGDVFLGITVPTTRGLARKYRHLGLPAAAKLLRSKIHEERLLALLLLVENFQIASEPERKRIFDFYLRHTAYINNWDLVDLSADKIVGGYLWRKPRGTKVLAKLARSCRLWERRIAILATFQFIKNGKPEETLKIAKILLRDEQDLLHKAVGWMLREVGKRDQALEASFLKKHYRQMPRTMLRYAIERFPRNERQKYLRGEI